MEKIDDLYIILSFNVETVIWSHIGSNNCWLYSLSLNNNLVYSQEDFNELEKFLKFNITAYRYEKYSNAIYFSFESIIKIINEILKVKEYTIVSISEDKNNLIKYHLVKTNSNKVN